MISAVAAVPGQTTATITWTTNEASTSRVDYGTTATALTSSASSVGLTTSHSVLLTGLTAGTRTFFKVTSADAAGNSTTAPASATAFTTTGTQPGKTVGDSSTADFGAGTPGTGAYVSETTGGELILTPTVGAEFGGATLPVGWTSIPWATGGASTVAQGVVTVDGARAQTDALFGPGASLEFVATFGTAGFQHVGFGVTLDAAPWAIFSTRDGGALYARTNTGATSTDTPIAGNWLSAPHRYRIDWTTSSVSFFIDGTLVATHAVTIADTMRPIVSDAAVAGETVSVDWIRLTPYAASGTFTSRILDAGSSVTWNTASWTAQTPTGTSIALSARFGNSPTPDATWTSFAALASSGAALSQTSRYVQYSAVLSTTSADVTPVLQDVTFSAAAGAGTPAISIADRSIAEGNAGTTSAVVTLTLSAPSTSSVTVNYATAAGTATAGTDYTTTSGTATFAPGSTSTTITVPVLGDTTVEPNETVLVNLTAPVNATIADTQAVVTITNDDAAATPAISIADVAVNEGNAGVTSAVLTLTLSATSTSSVTVNYATAAGTATAGTDYTTTSGTATFAAGTTTTTITVPVLGDTMVEPTETVLVNLTAPVNATIADAQAIVTITNDDAAALPAIPIADRAIAEGNAGTTNAVVTLALSAASASTVTVELRDRRRDRHGGYGLHDHEWDGDVHGRDHDHDNHHADRGRHHGRAERDGAGQPDGAGQRHDCRCAGRPDHHQ